MTFIVLLLIIVALIGCLVATYIITKKKAHEQSKEAFLEKLWKKDKVKAVVASLMSILLGLVIGCVLLAFFIDGEKITFLSFTDGIQLIFFGSFKTGFNDMGNIVFGFNSTNIGNILFRATPLILTGLSVAVAFKTGLFNIGAPGQYLIGTAATLILALSIPTTVVPAFLVWIIAFVGGVLAGVIWGFIPGVFKAYLNVNEVITCIMCNWIAANFVTLLFDNVTGPFKHLLDPSGTKNLAYVYKTTENGVATIKLGLDKIFAGSQVNGGIIIAILIAILVSIVLNKTTFGYELKACGANKDASKYAGISEKRNIILSMGIAGGLAAAGASLYYLSGNTEFKWSTYQTLPAIGFNGIPAALLAYNNPVGVIFSSIFFSFLDVNGKELQNATEFNEHIVSIISAMIVYFAAFSLIFKQILNGQIKLNFNPFKKKEKATEEKASEVKVEETNDDSKKEASVEEGAR